MQWEAGGKVMLVVGAPPGPDPTPRRSLFEDEAAPGGDFNSALELQREPRALLWRSGGDVSWVPSRAPWAALRNGTPAVNGG